MPFRKRVRDFRHGDLIRANEKLKQYLVTAGLKLVEAERIDPDQKESAHHVGYTPQPTWKGQPGNEVRTG